MPASVRVHGEAFFFFCTFNFFFFLLSIQAIIYDFFPYQKCKKSEVAVPEGAGGTEGLFLEEMNLRLKYHRCTAQGGFPATG